MYDPQAAGSLTPRAARPLLPEGTTAPRPAAEIDPHLLRSMARSRAAERSAAPSDETVEVVVGLGALTRLIVEHNRRVMAGEPHDWSKLADALAEANRACREQVPVELHDVGDAGGR